MIAAAIFDVDGTLLDSMPVWRDAGARYLRSVGVTPEPGLSEVLFPMSFEEGAGYLKSHYALPGTLQEIESGVSAIIAEAYTRHIPLKPGVERFLAQLRDLGIPMVLATTGDPALISAALERLGVLAYFRRTFTCAELNTTKRQPDVYLAAASYLGAPPPKAAVFEDVLHAIRSARSAGFFTVAVEDIESAADRESIRLFSHVYLRDFTNLDTFWPLAASI